MIKKKTVIKKKTKSKDAQRHVLYAIWDHFGGPARVARMLKLPKQTVVNWSTRGKVPLVKVPFVAGKLGIPQWGLNYADLVEFYFDHNNPSWAQTVKELGLDPKLTKRLLYLDPP